MLIPFGRSVNADRRVSSLLIQSERQLPATRHVGVPNSHPCHWRWSASTSTSLDNTELLVKQYIRPFHRFFWRLHGLDSHLSPLYSGLYRFLSSFLTDNPSIPPPIHIFAHN